MPVEFSLTDVKTLRSQARKHIEEGAIAAGRLADLVEGLSKPR